MRRTYAEHTYTDRAYGLGSLIKSWNRFSRIFIFMLSFMGAISVYTSPVLANPQGGEVTAGTVIIQQAPNSTTINQSSQKAIINWQSFNIGQQEATHFQQPAGGVALNRINPAQGASQIYGHLTATGQIILINSAGIYFGPSAYVNVGGLIASTANITDQSFLSGVYYFAQDAAYSGAILNEGQIIAMNHGMVALISSNVSNTGLIQANFGRIILASGNAFVINFDGTDLISFTVDEKSLNGSVNNTGTLRADGGKIFVTAKSAANVLDNIINMGGVVQARSAGMQNGEIILFADGGNVKVTGTIDASGKQVGEKGGKVKILGSQVVLDGNAHIDVSGDVGGGEVLIGGNAYGAGPELNANYTYFGSNVIVNADAQTLGDGGTVIVWSDLGTGFYGNISARGGSEGGNGGFVETSGKDYLDAMGGVDASANAGLPGQWLLDPRNVTITTSTSNGAFNNGSPNIYTPTGNNANVNAATINTSLNGGTSVTITTGSTGTQAGTITVNSAILKSSGLTTPTLTLNAASTIAINNTISFTSGGLILSLLSGGAITQSSPITVSSLTVNSGANPITLTNATNNISGAISLTNTGANNVALTDSTPLSLGTTSVGSGTLSLISGGSITQTGTITRAAGAGTMTLSSTVANADVLLNTQTNNWSGTLTFGGTLGNIRDVALRNTNATATLPTNLGSLTALRNLTLQYDNAAIAFPAVTLHSGGNLAVIAGGAITQTGVLTVPGTSSFTTGASAITLTQNNAFTGAVSLSNSGASNVAVTNGTALVLGTSSIGSGTLGLTASGNITQTGVITQAASAGLITFTLNAISSSINLSTQANSFSGSMVFAGTLANVLDFAIRNINSGATLPTNLASLTNLRNLTLLFDNAAMAFPALILKTGGSLIAIAGGSISQTGALTVPGTASFNAGANAITLTQNNAFTGAVTLSNNTGSGNVAVVNSIGLNMAASTLGSGTLSLTGAGVSQSGAITQTAGAGAVTINAGANAINLGNANNIFTGAVSLNNSGANNVALTNNASLILGASILGAGTFNIAANGTISESGAITQAGAGAITLTQNAVNSDILLGTQANNLLGAISFGGTLSNIRDVSLRNINASATLPTNLGSLSNLRNLTLQFNNSGIIFPAITLTSGGNLAAIAGGAITETGALTIPGTASFSAGTNAITLTQSNTFLGGVTLTNSGNNNVSVTTSGALSIAAANVGSGTLTLTSVGISQSGAIIQAASAGAVMINAGASVINLANSNNIFTGAVSLNNSGANNAQLTNSVALILGTSNLGSGALGLTSGGSISETGPIVQAASAGTITFNLTAPSSDILLSSQLNSFSGATAFAGTLGNVRDAAIRNISANVLPPVTDLQLLTNSRNLTLIFDNAGIVIPTLTLHSGGNLIIDTSGALSGGTGGSIIQTGVITVPGTSSFNAGSHIITLTQNNSFSGAVTLTNTGNNNVALTNSGLLTLATSSVGSGTLTLTGLGVSQTGAIVQAASAGAAIINAGSAAINLSNAGNTFTGAASLNNSGANNVAFVNSAALTLGASTVGTGTLSLTSGGDITQTGALLQPSNAGAITLASTVASTNIDLSTAANDLSAAITFGGTLANIQDFKLRNTNSGAMLPTNLASLVNLRHLTLVFNNTGMILPAFALHSGGNLSVLSGGNISQTGILTVPGTASFTVGPHAIILTQNNTFIGDITLSNSGNNDVSITASSALSLGTSNVGSGVLTLTGAGVSQSGAIIQAASAGAVMINAGANSINLANSGNIFTGAVSLNNSGANNVALTNSIALVLGTSNIGSGTLGLTSGGSISETGPVVQAASAGTITFNLTAPSSDLLLASQPNSFSGATAFAGTLGNVRDVAIRNISANVLPPVTDLQLLTNSRNLTLIFDNAGMFTPTLTLHSGGNLIFDTSGSLSGGTGGSITQVGIITVPGTSSFNAGAHTITLTQNNLFSGAITLTNTGNNNIALTNSGLLTLATSSVGSGTLTLTGLGVAQTGAIVQAASAGAALINAGAGAINLSNAGNTFTGAVSLNNSGANNVSLSNVNALILGTSSLGTGTLAITATGAISEVGAITQAAGAGNVTINANGNSISLTQDNNFTGAVALFNTGLNNVALTNDDALVLNTSSIGSDTFTIIANGPITQIGVISQAASAGSTSFSANANAITLTQNNLLSGAVSLNNTGANNVALTNAMRLILGTSSIGTGTLDVVANGPLTQTGAITQAVGASAASFNVNANAITLTQNNTFTGDVLLSNSGDHDVSLTNISALSLGTTNVGSGLLTLTGVGVSQTGAITQAASADIATINAGAGAITLSNASNSFTGAVSLNNSGANNVALRNNAPLTLSTSSVGTGTLAITTNGSLSQSGPIIQAAGAGIITLISNAINSDMLLNTQNNNLNGAISFGGTLSNIRDVALLNINTGATLPTNLNLLTNLRHLNVTFENTGMTLSTMTLSGNLTATAGGSIIQSGALIVAGTPTFTVTATQTVADLLLASAANNFSTTPVITSNGNIRDLALRNVAGNAAVPTLPTGLRNLTLTFNNTSITLPAMSLTGNLTVTAGGNIGQSAALNVDNTGAVTTLSAGSNNISLTNINNRLETLIINSGQDVSITNASNIDLGASTISGSFTVNVDGPITQSGGLSVSGPSSFAAGSANDITLTSLANDFSTVAIASGDDVTLTDLNDLDLATSVISGNLTVNTNGNLTQSGALTVNSSGKTTIFAVNAGTIILTNVNNDFTNLAVTSSNNVSITDNNAINLAASTIGGDFNLTTNGAITQSGAIIANGIGKITTLNAGSTGDISLNLTTNNFSTLAISNARAVFLRDASDLTLNSISSLSFATVVDGNLTTTGLIKTAGGDVSLTTTEAGIITVGASGIDTSTDQVSPGGSIFITAANTGDLAESVIINGVLDTRGGSGGLLILGGGVQLNQAPVSGAGNISLDGSSHSQFFGNLTFTTAQIIAVANADLIINGPISSTGVGSNLTFIADSTNTGFGGIRVTSTGSVDSSGTLSLSGSNLFVNPGVSIELQTGSSLIAAGVISVLGNIGNSNIRISGPITSTGLNQAITITPTGIGEILLGANVSTNAGAINLSTNTQLISNVTLTTSGGNIAANTILGVGRTLTLDVGSSTDLNLTSVDNDIGTVAITSGRNIELANISDIDLAASTISGNLTVTAGENITNSGALDVTGTSTFTSNNAGGITLTQSGNDFNTVAIMNAGDVSIQDANAIDLGPINISGNLQVLANGAITQTGGTLLVNEVNKSATFAAGIANNITLNNAANDFTAVAITSGNNVILQDANALNLGNITLAGDLTITTSGDITQSGILTQDGSNKTVTLAAGITNNISLDNSANTIDNITITNGNNVTLINADAINFNTSTISGNLTVSALGTVSQTGPLTVLGTANFNSDGASLLLTQAANQFTGAVSFMNTGNNNVAITNSGLLTIGPATSSVGSGTLTLTGLGIIQTGAITQAANAGAVTINAGAGVISFGNTGNTFTGPVSLNNSGANNVALTNSGALTLGASNVGTGTLALTAGGTINEIGAIVQAANAGTVTISVTAPSSDILLASQANSFSGAIVYGGTLSNIRDLGRRNVAINAGLTSTNIDLLVNLRNLTLILDNANLFAPAFTLHNGGNLYVDTSGALSGGTGGNILQLGIATIPGTATLIAGNHSITANLANNIGGEVFLSNSGNNNVSIRNSNELRLGAANVGSGTLTLTGLGVSQTGAITQAVSAGSVIVNAGAGAISLDNASNLFTGAVSLNNSGNNNVSLTNSTALILGTSTVGSGTLALTAGGTISETGAIVQAANAGTVTISVTAPSSDILLASQPNSFSGAIVYGGTLSNIRDLGRRNVAINAGLTSTNIDLLVNLRNLTLILDNANLFAPAFTLHNGGNLYVDTSGALSGGTGGNILQLGIATIPGTATLIAGNHSITANLANNIGGEVFLSNSGNNNVSIRNSNELRLGAANVGSGTLTLTGLGVSQTGAITQAVSAGNVLINAGAATINLSNTGNNFTGAVSLNNSGANNVALVNSGALILGASTVGTGTLSLTSGGNLTQTGALLQPSNAGAITLASTIANTNIDLSTAANNLSAAITFGGTLANIQDFKLRNISNDAILPTNVASLTNLRNLTLTFDNAGIILPAFTLHSGGSLSVISGGDISQTEALSIPGAASFTAGPHRIILTQNNTFIGDVTLSNSGGNDVSITAGSALSLGTSNVGSGALTLTGAGVSQSGAITQAASAGDVTVNAGAGIINLGISTNSFTGAIALNNSGANDVQLTNTQPILLRTSNIGSGALGLTSGGNISQTGPITQAAGAGVITVTFTSPNSDFLLGTQPNNLSSSFNIGGDLSNVRDVDIWNIGTNSGAVFNLLLLTNLRNLTVTYDNIANLAFPALTLHNGGNLVVNSSGAASGGTGGEISQTGALTIPGTSSFNAGSHAIMLTQDNSFSGDVTLINTGNNNVAITNSGLLTLATSSVGSGTLTLTGLGVSQSGGIIQAASAGATVINAGAGAIALSNTSNSFTGPVSFNNSGNNNVTLINSGNLTLDTSTLGSGTLSLTASGNMIAVGAITQAANAGVITLTENTDAADIIFDQANNLSGAIVFGGDLSFIHDLSLRNIYSNASLPTNLSSLSDLASLTLVFDNTGISLPTLSLHSGGNLSIDTSGVLSGGTGGSITQTGVLTIPGTSSFNAGAHAIALTQSNQFTGAVTLTNSGNNNVAVTNSGELLLGTSSVGSGTLSLTSIGLSQSGAVTQATSAAAVTINSGAGIIDLSNAGNRFTGEVSLNNSGNDNVSLTNSIALALGTSNIGSGTLALTAGGTISETGAIIQAANAGTITLSVTTPSADILLASQANDLNGGIVYSGTVSNIRDVGLRNINVNAAVPTSLSSLSSLRHLTIIFDQGNAILPTFTSSGNVIASAGGTIAQSGAISGIDLTTSSVDGTTLNHANTFSSFNGTNTTSGDIAFTNSAPLAITGMSETGGNIVINNTGGITIADAVNANGGNITLTGTGIINESGSGTLIGGLLTTSSVGGTSLINNNSVTGFNGINSGGGNIQLMNTATLIISGITQTDSGNVTVTNTGALTTTGAINTNGGDVTLQTLSPDSAARLLTIGSAGIATTGGSIDLNAANPDDQLFALAVNGVLDTSPGTGGIFTINPGVYFTVNPIVGAGNITLNGNGLDFIGGFVTLPENFVLRAPRNIILIGPVTTTNGASFSLFADDDHDGIGGVLIENAGSLDATGELILQGSNLSTAPNATDPNAGVEIQSGAFVRSTANISLLGNIGSNANITINGLVEVTGTGSSITVTPAGTGIVNLGANVTSQSGAINLNGPVLLSTDVTLTGLSIALNNGVSGGQDLSLIGVAGNNLFTLTGPLALNNITVTGSATGDNTLAVNSGSFENWIITGENQGNIATTGVTGTFAFTAIQNLTGGNNGNTFTFNDGTSISGLIDGGDISNVNTLNYALYTTPINVLLANSLYSGDTQNNLGNFITHFMGINNLIGSEASVLQLPNNATTLTFNSAVNGFVNGPLNFNQFSTFITPNSTDDVVFVANGVFNLATNSLTVNGTPVQLTGFNASNFSGNISFINGPPPPTPVPVPPVTPGSSVSSVLTPFNNPPMSASSNALPGVLITNNTVSGDDNGNIIITGTSVNTTPTNASSSGKEQDDILAVLQHSRSELQNSYLDSLVNTPMAAQSLLSFMPFANWLKGAPISNTEAMVILLMALAMISALVVHQPLNVTTSIPVNHLNALAMALSTANLNNIALRTVNPLMGIPINNAMDLGKLLKNGLPKDYIISYLPIYPNATVSCIIISPSFQKAFFTATGIE